MELSHEPQPKTSVKQVQEVLPTEAVADAAIYAQPDALDQLFTRLRREEPVAWTEPEGFRPFWLLTRYKDMLEAEEQADVFSTQPHSVLLTEDQERRAREASGCPSRVRTLVHMDEPGHAAYRGLTHSWFMAQNLQRLEGRVRMIAKSFCGRMKEMGGACDFARDMAYLYPLRVNMLILGIPDEDEALMLNLARILSRHVDQSLAVPEDGQAQSEALSEFAEYLAHLARSRRDNPRQDLASVIANGQIDGRPITDEEAVSYYLIAAAAGHDTTSAVAAGGMLALIQHPDQFAKLKADLSLVPSAIDEFVRWTTPVKHFMRTATSDYELGGRTIQQGQSVMMHFQSANRDEEAYEDPFTLQVDRKPNRHLAFGYGPHQCLGRYLALMEMTAFYEELMPSLAEIEVNGPPRFTPSYFVSGLDSLPMTYRMA